MYVHCYHKKINVSVSRHIEQSLTFAFTAGKMPEPISSSAHISPLLASH